MTLIDEYVFFAEAGRGGDGVVRWRREKFRPKGGPSGGDGGHGGDFYIEAVRDITALKKISQKNKHKAEDGKPGAKNSMHGADGKDFTLYLPIGSVITNKDNGVVYELLNEGDRVRILNGGEGGLGNENFKSSTNQTPMHATKGKEGESGNFTVELKLIADIGLIGLPNVGKTSLLNELTNTNAKVANYPFTTLGPNLGVYYNYILADIPGIIEGASKGKGLGYKFLRHISRTNAILHCISLERDNILQDYVMIRNELKDYPDILEKDEYIVLTKSDTVDSEKIKNAEKEIKGKIGKDVFVTVSVFDDKSIKIFGDSLIKLLRNKS